MPSMERENTMLIKTPTSGRIAALTAACLIGVALPAATVVAKEKIKPAAAEPAALEVDYSISIPTIDTVDSSLSDAILAEILGGNIIDHADDLADLDASSISVPEIVVNVTSQSDDGP